MIIDSTHKRWIQATAILGILFLSGYLTIDAITPGGLTGGSVVGLWYGIVGTALMIFAGLLSALRRVPSWWWIGSRKAWLRGHIWLGLLSVILILCHCRFRWGGVLEQGLLIVFALTILSGIYGLIVQHIVPRMITTRVTCEAPFEQIPHLCQVMRRKADALLTTIWTSEKDAPQASVMMSQMGMGAKVQLQEFYEKHVRPFLSETWSRPSLLANSLRAEAAFARLRALPGLADVKDQLSEIEALCGERRSLAAQERLHYWLHAWLMLHIPLSVLLLVLGMAHIVIALYY